MKAWHPTDGMLASCTHTWNGHCHRPVTATVNAKSKQIHNAAVAAIWANAPGHDSIVALNRGYGAHSSDDLTLDQDALARNEINALVAMPAMVMKAMVRL
jgi:hypothetical protein